MTNLLIVPVAVVHGMFRSGEDGLARTQNALVSSVDPSVLITREEEIRDA